MTDAEAESSGSGDDHDGHRGELLLPPLRLPDKLLELYESQPEFVQPDARRNEVMAFVRAGLNDLSISRSTLRWGIPLPNDPAHVFYVWFDALTTYMSAIGYGEHDGPGSDYERLWPIDVHLVGKEIVRFHAVYWPAFLMAAGLPLPKQVWAHGWLIFQGGKMSKTKGNIVRALPIKRVVGVDGLRYYLLREIVFGQDGNFSHEALTVRYNADLANGIGNLASRTSSMLARYCDGKVPEAVGGTDSGGLPDPLATLCIGEAIELYRKFAFSKALEKIWSLLARTDKYIVEHKPWELARRRRLGFQDPARGHPLQHCRGAANRLRAAGAGHPDRERRESGNCSDNPVQSPSNDWTGCSGAGWPREQRSARKPRSIPARCREVRGEHGGARGRRHLAGAGPAAWGARRLPQAARQSTLREIEIGDFAKVDMRVGVVRAADRVKKSRKLLQLSVDIGEAEPRTILSGIGEKYGPDEMVGRRIAVVANLKPRKMMGQLVAGHVNRSDA